MLLLVPILNTAVQLSFTPHCLYSEYYALKKGTSHTIKHYTLTITH